MSQPLSDQTIALVKATVPALEAHGLDIVHEMYSRMFQNTDIRDLFNQSHHGDAGSQPRALTLADEMEGRDYDAAGIITDEWLVANTPVTEAAYYICGPRPFLRHAVSTLSLAGVPSDRIHYEFFGPADELLAA